MYSLVFLYYLWFNIFDRYFSQVYLFINLSISSSFDSFHLLCYMYLFYYILFFGNFVILCYLCILIVESSFVLVGICCFDSWDSLAWELVWSLPWTGCLKLDTRGHLILLYWIWRFWAINIVQARWEIDKDLGGIDWRNG